MDGLYVGLEFCIGAAVDVDNKKNSSFHAADRKHFPISANNNQIPFHIYESEHNVSSAYSSFIAKCLFIIICIQCLLAQCTSLQTKNPLVCVLCK